MSALDTETTSEFTTFEHFGRSWSIPTKRHASHVRALRDMLRLSAAVGGMDLTIAETFLSPEVSPHNQQEPDQFEALLDIDPTDDELDAFATAIGKAMGVGDKGNSSPSSTSS